MPNERKNNRQQAGLVTKGSELSADSSTFESSKLVYDLISPDPTHWPVFFQKVMDMWDAQPTLVPEQLAEIQASVMVMAGEFDEVLTQHTERMASSIPGAKLKILKGGDHYIPMNMHEEVNELIDGFLADRD